MKEFTDNKLKFDENGRKYSKRIENTLRKGEIACHNHFLFFPQCFQKYKKQGLFGKGLMNILSRKRGKTVQVISLKLHPAKKGLFDRNVSEKLTLACIESLLTLSQTTDFRLFQTERLCR